MQGLKELLHRFSSEQLAVVRKTLHLKWDAASPSEADFSRLLQRLDNSERTRTLFAQLEPTEKHVLRYVLSQGGTCTEPEILERFPDAGVAIGRLREQYLLFENIPEDGSPTLCVPREYVRFISLTPAEKSTLANLFNKQPPAYYADVASAHGWTSSSREILTKNLKNSWLSEEKLKTFLDQLPEPEKVLWRFIVDADGVADTKALKRAGAVGGVQPGHLDRAQPLDNLYAYGLIFPNQWPNPACFVIPSDVLPLVKGKPAQRVLTAAAHTPSTLRSWGLRLLSDLQLLVAYQASGRLQFTQHDIPLRHQLRAFLKAIGVQEEAYGLFLNMSIEVFFGAVIKASSQTLDANPAESMSRLIVKWRDGERWQESSHWRDSRRSADGREDKTLKSKRLIVLKVLEALPVKEWVAYKDFEAGVFDAGWKRVDSGTHKTNAYYDNERWGGRALAPDLSAEETLANMTAENLAWLGFVDIGIGKIRKTGWDITHIRLTDWGHQFLDKKSGRFEPLPPIKADQHFLVLPNLEVSVSPRLRPDILAQLFKLAVLKGVNSFALTKESLREALDEGMTLHTILDFLKANSSREVPAIVQQFLEEVAQKHGHIKLGIAGSYLQVDDPVLLLELRSHRALKDLFSKQVGDQLALLNDRDLDRIAKVLRKKGYFPVIEKSAETERMKLKFHW